MVNAKMSGPFMNRCASVRMLPESSTISGQAAPVRGRRAPPTGTINCGAPDPSVPRTNSPMRAAVARVSRVAAAASPKIVRTLLSIGWMCLL